MDLFVTGFLPWANHEINPAEMAARYAVSLGVEGRILPVSYKAVGDFFASAPKRRYLLFGLAGTRSEATLERYAYNETKETLLDVDGKGPNSPWVLSEDQTKRETAIDLDFLSKELKEAGVPNHRSTDPGRYLCNYAYFHALSLSDGEALFVHLPPLSETFDEAQLRRLVDTLVRILR